jgi:hypothetical protein
MDSCSRPRSETFPDKTDNVREKDNAVIAMHLRVCLRFVVLLLSPCLLAASASKEDSASRSELGVRGGRFTVNGKETFLCGISYYGALGASEETIRRDLADLKRHGFNWLRVWATWAAFSNDVSAVDAEGRARQPFLRKLQWLVAECDRQDLVVDVTLSRGNGVSGPPRLQTPEAHRRAVETLVVTLKPHGNWYLDLSNERNIQDKRFTSLAELARLRELARTLDGRRLVTASHAGDITRDELREYLLDVRVDFLAPHRPRDATSAAQTKGQTLAYRAMMKEIGRTVPVHYQEPFRRGYGWQPRAEDYVTDWQGAKAGGAAGWCFHNGDHRATQDGQPRRSFDLRSARLFEQLDGEETRALRLLKAASSVERE